MYFNSFFPFLRKGLCVLNDEDEIAASACAGHFPGANLGKSTIGFDGLLNIVVILFGMTNVCWTNHPRKHRGLSFKRGFEGCRKTVKIMGSDGTPTPISCFGKSFNL